MKRQIKSSVDESEYQRILMKANEAKDRLYQVAQKLDEIGKHHKAKSCMTLIYMIEEWQNS